MHFKKATVLPYFKFLFYLKSVLYLFLVICYVWTL